MKKFLLLLLLFGGWSSILFAEKISYYHVDVTIQQNGELQIIETIYYNFEKSVSKHGIYRDIPFTVEGSVLPKDIGIGNFSIQMDGNKINWEQRNISNSFDAGEMIRIKIGSPSIFITGKHIYSIAYQVQKGVLPSSLDTSQDAIRWNTIGTGWNVPIEKTEINFYLPPSLSQPNVSVQTFKGVYGSKTKSQITWINNHHFQQKTDHLTAHEGLTTEVSYPAGLLGQTGNENMATSNSEKLLGNWHWPVMVIFILSLFGFLKKHSGVIDERSIAPRYTPPKGMNTLQAGLIYDKFTDNEDFSAAVLELGQKGYLEIFQKEKDNEPLIKKTQKSTKDLSNDLKYLMDHILFSKKRSYRLKGYSTTGSATLQDGFKKINQMLYDWSVKDGYIEEDPQTIRKKFFKISLWALLPITALSLYSIFMIYSMSAVIILLFASIFIGIGFFIMLSNKSLYQRFFGLIFVIAGGTQLIVILGFKTTLSLIFFSPVTAIIIIICAIYIVYHKIGAYTQKGADVHKHLLGLKEYMSRVKEDEIRRRLKDDPLYLENYLSYAVLFGITEHWLSLFDILDVHYPHWFHGSATHMSNFSSRMNNASISPSSSGGSSGGGFSGGGGGGGGGGSW